MVLASESSAGTLIIDDFGSPGASSIMRVSPATTYPQDPSIDFRQTVPASGTSPSMTRRFRASMWASPNNSPNTFVEIGYDAASNKAIFRGSQDIQGNNYAYTSIVYNLMEFNPVPGNSPLNLSEMVAPNFKVEIQIEDLELTSLNSVLFYVYFESPENTWWSKSTLLSQPGNSMISIRNDEFSLDPGINGPPWDSPVPLEQSVYSLLIWAQSPLSPGSSYSLAISDIRIVPVPEPGCAGALAGAILLFRRKRI